MTGIAGTLESSDAMITVKENAKANIEIHLESDVERQFGNQIRKVIMDKLKKMGVSEALVYINDKGAIDCTIEARLETAVYRAAGIKTYDWEVL